MTATNIAVSSNTMDILFRQARSHANWIDKSVNDETLRQLYELAKWGPTSMNCLPMRLVLVKSTAAKQRLIPCLGQGNVDKVQAAPVTVIIAEDTRFYENMPRLFPHMDNAEKMFAEDKTLAQQTAFRNSSLQGAYMIIAARSLGLDVGPMSGFDSVKLDKEFFPDGRYKTNFIMNIGFGDHATLHQRGPRLDFEEVAQVI
jgi:3-hydroxypropanoate dehydrogenase